MMDTVIEFLGLIGISDYQASTGKVKISCPFGYWNHSGGEDSEPSFEIKEINGELRFLCWGCGVKGDLLDLLFLMKDEYGIDPSSFNFVGAYKFIQGISRSLVPRSYEDLKNKGKRKPEVIFPEEWLNSFKPAYSVPASAKYLHEDRGIGPKLSEVLDIRVDTSRHRIGFPIRNRKGLLVGFRGRAMYDSVTPRWLDYDYKKEITSVKWFGINCLDFSKPIIVPESFFDHAKARAVYKNCASPLSSSLSLAMVQQIKEVGEIWTLFDNDKAGDKARSFMTDHFGTRVRHLNPGEWGDAGAMPIPEVRKLFSKYGLVD
jgi:hypothetical protein